MAEEQKETVESKPEPAAIKIGDEVALNEAKIGMSGDIVRVEGEGKIRRRLFDMGLTPGAEVFLRKKAPLGDPLEITLRGYELTLRKDEASHVILKITDLTAVDEAEAK
jgi:Fe2+ transport system protein FeoA